MVPVVFPLGVTFAVVVFLVLQFAFSHSNGSSYSLGTPGFSFLQTEHSQGNPSGNSWNNGNGEGSQYLSRGPSSSNRHAQNGISESFNSFQVAQDTQGSQETVRRSVSGPTQSHWDAELSAAHIESQEMSRLPSQDSIGAHSQRTTHSSITNSYDQTGSSRIYHNLSKVSFPISSASSDVTGRSISPESHTLCTPTQQLDGQTFDTFPYQSADDISGDHSVFHRNSTSAISSNTMNGSSYNNVFTSSGDEAFYLASHGPVSHDSLLYNPGSVNESPTLWDSNVHFLESQRSSPILPEDHWALPPPQMMTSTNSPLEYSPSVESLSPAHYVQDFPEMADLPSHPTSNRIMKKPIGPRQSKVNSDMARHPCTTGTSETSDESLKYTGRTLDIDNNARVHHLYHNASPQADGLYHCPWEGKDGCQHKPEKLKCNYDKFVDSHLKPYRCKVHQCENLQFSSTACLLRHEREAHAMHGHGEKPFLCTYDSCERGVSGNGFPRHWNLRDHMRRVHNDPGPPKSNASGGSPPPSGPTRGKKRKDRPESPVLEKNDKAVKRVPTPQEEPKQEPKESSSMERYQQSQTRLSNIVQKLRDPRAPGYVALFREASMCFHMMQKTAQDINAPILHQTG